MKHTYNNTLLLAHVIKHGVKCMQLFSRNNNLFLYNINISKDHRKRSLRSTNGYILVLIQQIKDYFTGISCNVMHINNGSTL